MLEQFVREREEQVAKAAEIQAAQAALDLREADLHKLAVELGTRDKALAAADAAHAEKAGTLEGELAKAAAVQAQLDGIGNRERGVQSGSDGLDQREPQLAAKAQRGSAELDERACA